MPASIAPGALAQAAAAAGRVRLNGSAGGQARPCAEGRATSSPWAEAAEVMAVRVLALAERRGPAKEAQTSTKSSSSSQLRAVRKSCGLNTLACRADAP